MQPPRKSRGAKRESDGWHIKATEVMYSPSTAVLWACRVVRKERRIRRLDLVGLPMTGETQPPGKERIRGGGNVRRERRKERRNRLRVWHPKRGREVRYATVITFTENAGKHVTFTGTQMGYDKHKGVGVLEIEFWDLYYLLFMQIITIASLLIKGKVCLPTVQIYFLRWKTNKDEIIN